MISFREIRSEIDLSAKDFRKDIVFTRWIWALRQIKSSRHRVLSQVEVGRSK